jgi:hypothetical protein
MFSKAEREAMWKHAEDLAQEQIDLMYPDEQEGIRAAKFEELREMYYQQMINPPPRRP